MGKVLVRAVAAFAVLAILGPVCADESPADPVEQAAADVRAALEAPAALAALAKQPNPDPWLVVEALRGDGHDEAARSFALRVDGPARPGLVEYAQRPIDARADRTMRSAIASARAHRRAWRYAEAREVLDTIDPPADSVAAMDHRTELAIARIGLGEYEAGEEAFYTVAIDSLRMGWSRRSGECLIQAFNSLQQREGLSERLEEFKRHRLPRAEVAHDGVATRVWLSCLAVCYLTQGRRKEALKYFMRRLGVATTFDDFGGIAMTNAQIGHTYAGAGQAEEALAAYARALEIAEPLGFQWCEAITLGGRASVYGGRLGDVTRSMKDRNRTITIYEELRSPFGLGNSLYNSAVLRMQLADYDTALTRLREARRLLESVGARSVLTLSDVLEGVICGKRGEYAEALARFEKGRSTMEALGQAGWVARIREGQLLMYLQIGRTDLVEKGLNEILAERVEQGDVAGEAQALNNLAHMQYLVGRYDEALVNARAAVDSHKKRENVWGIALGQANVGSISSALGDHAEGASALRVAVDTFTRAGHQWKANENRTYLADALRKADRLDEALDEARKALDDARDPGARGNEVRALDVAARCELAKGRPAEAIRLASEAVEPLGLVAHAFADDLVAFAKAQYAGVFDVGAEAAFDQGDADTLAFFLETGRAGALLDALGSRAAVRDAVMPPKWRELDAQARAEERSARNAYRAAGTKRKALQEARARVAAAQRARRDLIQRMHHEKARGTRVAYPSAASLEEMQSLLSADEALVLYGAFDARVVALVIRKDAASPVDLGPREAITKAIEATPFSDAAQDTASGAARLRRLLLDPLALPTTTKRVLVSPVAEICLVPFAALSNDRVFTYVPSGTTYAVLQRDAKQTGRGVLAFGDPDYTSHPGLLGWRTPLAPLPATGKEAHEVGDDVLTGKDATEAAFRARVDSRDRWRAVHVACHGVADVSEPSHSFLALSANPGDDGLLTMLDVMRLRVPADLVVLSACETARGPVIRGEGLVGMAQAFMTVGGPRVISSLWRADDAATRMLMVKFYELWNPDEGERLDAGEALRRAQTFVRDHEHHDWSHAYYWAGWSLWGLPR